MSHKEEGPTARVVAESARGWALLEDSEYGRVMHMLIDGGGMMQSYFRLRLTPEDDRAYEARGEAFLDEFFERFHRHASLSDPRFVFDHALRERVEGALRASGMMG